MTTLNLFEVKKNLQMMNEKNNKHIPRKKKPAKIENGEYNTN